jgi:hypothetical protein
MNSFSSQRNARDGLGVLLERWKGCRPRVAGCFARSSLCLSNARTSVTSCVLDRLHFINITRLLEMRFECHSLQQMMQECNVFKGRALHREGATKRLQSHVDAIFYAPRATSTPGGPISALLPSHPLWLRHLNTNSPSTTACTCSDPTEGKVLAAMTTSS